MWETGSILPIYGPNFSFIFHIIFKRMEVSAPKNTKRYNAKKDKTY